MFVNDAIVMLMVVASTAGESQQSCFGMWWGTAVWCAI